MIKVYQIPSEVMEQYDIFPSFYGRGKLFDLQSNLDKYVHVADLNTNSLDEAFEIGNIGPESKYTRYARMHSLSVGDILVDETGQAHVIASFGFDEIESDLEAA
jgi:hypothetical protein